MPPPLPPLRARNRLAETILEAMHDPVARRVLAGLAGDETAVRDWLGPDEAAYCHVVRARAQRANATVASVPLRAAAGGLAEALEDAALLFDAGLFFETHELLEPYWRQASGEARQALQGLIQIAVGYQHRVDANAPGARSLLVAGVGRVRGRRLLGMRLDGFAAAVEKTLRPPGTVVPVCPAIPRFPRTPGHGESAASQPPSRGSTMASP